MAHAGPNLNPSLGFSRGVFPISVYFIGVSRLAMKEMQEKKSEAKQQQASSQGGQELAACVLG